MPPAKKTLLQPKCCTNVPPKKGPIDMPKYMDAAFIPMALPRSPGGKTHAKMATEVVTIIAPPIPWTTLKDIRDKRDGDTAAKKFEAANKMAPKAKIFFLPTMSASLPMGTREAAVANRYVVATHPKRTALAPNSRAIEGSDIFTEDIINGERKEATAEITKTLRFQVTSASFIPTSLIYT